MDFLKKFTEATKIDTKETPATTTATPTGTADEQPPSQSDLFASAQVLAQAARSTIQKDPTNVDNYKLAGAAADILDAAEHYGKIDTSTGVGSYVEKAEGYLKKYESSSSPPPKSAPVETEPKSTTTTPDEEEEAASDEPEKKVSHPPPATEEASEETTEKTVSHPPPAEEAYEETEKTVAPPPVHEVVTEEKAIPPPVAEPETAPEEPAAAAESKGEAGYGSALKAAGDFWKKN